MTLHEKITILNNVSYQDFIHADIPGIGYSFEENRAYIRKDFRKFISETLERENVSIRKLALAVGMNYSNLFQYLKGTRPIPEKYLERIIGLLE